MKHIVRISLIFILAGLGSVTAFAQDVDSPLDPIFACADIQEDQERWACYDTQVPLLRARSADQEVIALDSKKVEEIKRDAFGFSLPKLKFLKSVGKTDDDKSENVNAFEIESIRKTRSGLIITMQNGHVWQQVTGEVPYVPKGKLTASIKRASFGSFLLSIKNEKGKTVKRGIRVKRVK